MTTLPLKSGSRRKESLVRDQILLEAKRLFRERGYAAVSINDIIERVGVTKPTLYHYFSDKESLFTDVLQEVMRSGSVFVNEQEHLKGRSIAEQLIVLAAGFIHYSPTSIATLLRDASEHLSAEHQAVVQKANQEFMIQPIAALLRPALQEGVIGLPLAAEKTALSRVEITQCWEEQANILAVLFISYLDAFTVWYRYGGATCLPLQPTVSLPQELQQPAIPAAVYQQACQLVTFWLNGLQK
ncbi:MAG: TetR/AcrR family transcriptional regulator [Vampirovibrionales bacterium]